MAEEERPHPHTFEGDKIQLDIAYHFPEDSRLIFSDNIAIQHSATEFTITFAQVRQPIVQDIEELKVIQSVRADVVARVVLTPTKMLEFIRAMKDNWAIFENKMKALMETRTDVNKPEIPTDR